MLIIEIDLDSPAGRELRELVATPHAYCIRIAPDHGGAGTVALKLNGGMWSAPLYTMAARVDPDYDRDSDEAMAAMAAPAPMYGYVRNDPTTAHRMAGDGTPLTLCALVAEGQTDTVASAMSPCPRCESRAVGRS